MAGPRVPDEAARFQLRPHRKIGRQPPLILARVPFQPVVTVRTADGRYQSIVYAPDFDCKGGGSNRGGGNWAGGSGHGNGHANAHGVTLYRDLNFAGLTETYTNDVPDMRKTRFGDDNATSVSIGRGCTARLYRDLDFGGPTRVTSDIECDLRGQARPGRRLRDVELSEVRCGGGGGWGSGDNWGGGDAVG